MLKCCPYENLTLAILDAEEQTTTTASPTPSLILEALVRRYFYCWSLVGWSTPVIPETDKQAMTAKLTKQTNKKAKQKSAQNKKRPVKGLPRKCKDLSWIPRTQAGKSQSWWCTLAIPVLGRQRETRRSPGLLGQPDQLKWWSSNQLQLCSRKQENGTCGTTPKVVHWFHRHNHMYTCVHTSAHICAYIAT